MIDDDLRRIAATRPGRRPYIPCELPTSGTWCVLAIGHHGECTADVARTRPGYATCPGITPAGDPTWPPLRTQAEVRAERPPVVIRTTDGQQITGRLVEVTASGDWLVETNPLSANVERWFRATEPTPEPAPAEWFDDAVLAAAITGMLGLELTPWQRQVLARTRPVDPGTPPVPPPGEWEAGPDRCPPDCVGCRVAGPLGAWTIATEPSDAWVENLHRRITRRRWWDPRGWWRR